MKTDPDIAWAAGLFEGEGCISIRPIRGRTRRRSAQLVLTSTDHDVVIRFAAIVGAGRIVGPFSRPSRKPAWRWQVESAVGVIRVLRLLNPYLCRRRREKATEALEVAWRIVCAKVISRAKPGPETTRVTGSSMAQLRAALGEE